MFMGIPFLIHAALYVEDPAERQDLFDDAARQVLGFNSQVWDPVAKLYMHARHFGNPAKLPYWSRCNGWASWAMSEVLLHLRESHPDYGAILAHFQCHCASLLKFQDVSGLWPNVLNRPDSPLEVSGTAIFVMAMARGLQHGWLAEDTFRPALENAWQALDREVDPDGTVHRICMGTMCTEDVEYYVNRPFYDNDTHGLFAVLFAGIEMHRLLDAKESMVPGSRRLTPVG
jgi:rhamnogalacturonyl hydrolase YesR